MKKLNLPALIRSQPIILALHVSVFAPLRSTQSRINFFAFP